MKWNGWKPHSFIHVRGYFIVKIQMYIKCLYMCMKCFIYLYFHKGCFSVNLAQCLAGRGLSPWTGWLPPWAPCANTLITPSLCTNLFLAGLGLYFCMWSLSSGGQRGVVENRLQANTRVCRFGVWPSHGGDFSCCEARAQELCGWPSLFHDMWNLWTGDQTCVPCIGKWILSHCTTREIPEVSLKINWEPSTLFLLVLWADVYGVAQSRTRLKWLSTSSRKLV